MRPFKWARATSAAGIVPGASLGGGSSDASGCVSRGSTSVLMSTHLLPSFGRGRFGRRREVDENLRERIGLVNPRHLEARHLEQRQEGDDEVEARALLV